MDRPAKNDGASSGGAADARGSLHVLLADEHPAVLAAVQARLEYAGFGSVTTAVAGDDAVAVAAERRPDVAVVDLPMPHPEGAELVGALRDAAPGLRVLVYTVEADAHAATELLEAGADGLLLKEAPLSELAVAVEAVAAGRPYVDPAVAAMAPPPRLTERERQVLALAAEGLPHDQIGRRLGIGAETCAATRARPRSASAHERAPGGRHGDPPATDLKASSSLARAGARRRAGACAARAPRRPRRGSGRARRR